MNKGEVIFDPIPEHQIDEFTMAVWNLIYCMVERGVTGAEDSWWGEDFMRVRSMLEAKGLNTDPSKNADE